MSSMFSFSMAEMSADLLRGSTQLMSRISGFPLYSSSRLEHSIKLIPNGLIVLLYSRNVTGYFIGNYSFFSLKTSVAALKWWNYKSHNSAGLTL